MYYITNFRHKKKNRKVFAENIVCILKRVINFSINGKKVKTILFYPQFPTRLSVLYKVASSLNCNITNNPKVKHHLAVYWDDTTYRKPDEKIIEIANQERVVNINCRDISKSKVEKTFMEVFGYSYRVDSQSYNGLIVKKSEKNASHDGKIIQGPVSPEEGFIYMKLINNQYDDELVVDMRIPIVNGLIPFIYLKYKPIKFRFAHYRKAKQRKKAPERYSADALLSAEEISNINTFCKKMGLDYGEIDVLRDRDDQKIYIVDANNTPNGPSIEKKLKKDSVKKIADMFQKEFLI